MNILNKEKEKRMWEKAPDKSIIRKKKKRG